MPHAVDFAETLQAALDAALARHGIVSDRE